MKELQKYFSPRIGQRIITLIGDIYCTGERKGAILTILDIDLKRKSFTVLGTKKKSARQWYILLQGEGVKWDYYD